MSRRKIDETSRKATPSGMSIVKRVKTDSAPVEKIVSETDEQIHKLYNKQSDVDVTLGGLRKSFKRFTTPAVYKSSLQDVRGERSLQTYHSHELEEIKLQKLRDCGLSEQEIALWCAHSNSQQNAQHSSSMNPEVLSEHLAEIEMKISQHEERVKRGGGFSSAQGVSRHKMELERALNQGRVQQSTLSSLVIKPRSLPDESNTPESELRRMAEELSDRPAPIPDYGDPFPNPWVLVTPKPKPTAEFVGPRERDPDLSVSDDDIYANRLGVDEIKQLPRFEDYTPGPASNVLYVKNLSSSVKREHLVHLFGRFRVLGDQPITCKLMSGRMRGQAFVTCADVETASRCLNTLCGYKLKGRPMIISYSRSKPAAEVGTSALTPRTEPNPT